MEKYIITENTVQYYEGCVLVWEDSFKDNADKKNIIAHLEECNANIETLSTIDIDNVISFLRASNISYDQWEDDYLVINGNTYNINIEVTEDYFNIHTTHHVTYEKESNLMYGDTDKANANYKTYKSMRGLKNYILKYWN